MKSLQINSKAGGGGGEGPVLELRIASFTLRSTILERVWVWGGELVVDIKFRVDSSCSVLSAPSLPSGGICLHHDDHIQSIFSMLEFYPLVRLCASLSASCPVCSLYHFNVRLFRVLLSYVDVPLPFHDAL